MSMHSRAYLLNIIALNKISFYKAPAGGHNLQFLERQTFLAHILVLRSDVHTNSIELIYSPLKQIFKTKRGKYLDTFHTLIPHDTVE